ncbi:MAG: DUF4390 domain-containing protein [Gemmatimonadales bacterium]
MRRGLASLALLYGAATAAAAQASPPSLAVTLDGRTPRVRASALLADGTYAGLMRSGFPLRLHFRLELWRVRANWFDQFQRDVTWDLVARHDPLTDDYVLIRAGRGGSVTRYATLEELARALEIPYRIPLATTGQGRFYFLCRLEVTTLNDSDLEELERWLRGDVGPAVSGGGNGNLGDALARGAQRVLVRIAGLPRLTLEARSARFRVER